MKTLKKIFAVITAITAMAAGTGCKKEVPESGYMNVQMREARTSDGSAPTNPTGLLLSAVNLDIKSVEVHYANEAQGNNGWVALNTNAGIYDLLMFKNDITATLAGDTRLPVGTITQMRLILGPNNSVFVEGDAEHSLTVPGGTETGIKINVNASIPAGEHTT